MLMSVPDINSYQSLLVGVGLDKNLLSEQEITQFNSNISDLIYAGNYDELINYLNKLISFVNENTYKQIQNIVNEYKMSTNNIIAEYSGCDSKLSEATKTDELHLALTNNISLYRDKIKEVAHNTGGLLSNVTNIDGYYNRFMSEEVKSMLTRLSTIFETWVTIDCNAYLYQINSELMRNPLLLLQEAKNLTNELNQLKSFLMDFKDMTNSEEWDDFKFEMLVNYLAKYYDLEGYMASYYSRKDSTFDKNNTTLRYLLENKGVKIDVDKFKQLPNEVTFKDFLSCVDLSTVKNPSGKSVDQNYYIDMIRMLNTADSPWKSFNDATTKLIAKFKRASDYITDFFSRYPAGTDPQLAFNQLFSDINAKMVYLNYNFNSDLLQLFDIKPEDVDKNTSKINKSIDDATNNLNDFNTITQAVLQNLDKTLQHLIDLLNDAVKTYGFSLYR